MEAIPGPDYRHAYASLLIAHGAPPKYIQGQLGHHSIQITMDLYGHLFEGDHRRYVEALDTVLDATPRKPRAIEFASISTPLDRIIRESPETPSPAPSPIEGEGHTS